MTIIPILEAPDPCLRVNSTPVKSIHDGLRTLNVNVFAQVYEAPEIGLAVQ